MWRSLSGKPGYYQWNWTQQSTTSKPKIRSHPLSPPNVHSTIFDGSNGRIRSEFSTFEPLDVKALEGLSASLIKGWREEENEELSESYEEHLISCGFPVCHATDWQNRRQHGAEGSDNATLSTMLAHFAQLNTSDSESELEGS